MKIEQALNKVAELGQQLILNSDPEVSHLWRSLSANPPDFDLVTDIGMTAAQKRSLLAFLEGLKL